MTLAGSAHSDGYRGHDTPAAAPPFRPGWSGKGSGKPEEPRLPEPMRSGAAAEARFQARIFQTTDLLVVLSVLLLVFVATNLKAVPEGFPDFLGMRITLKNLLLIVAFAGIWRVLCLVTGLLDWRTAKMPWLEFRRVMLTCTLISVVALGFPAISVTGAFRYSAILWFWLGAILGIVGTRHLIRAVARRSRSGAPIDALIVGAGARGQRLYRRLASPQVSGYNVVGFVDSVDDLPSVDRHEKLLGSLEDLEGVLMQNAIDEVLIVLPIKSRYVEIQNVLESCDRVGVRARYLADLFEQAKYVSEVDEDVVSLVAAPKAPRGWRLVVKRAIDIAGASLGLVLLSPVLGVAAVAIKLTSPGPVLYTQPRHGLNRRLFRMYKLRSMVADADARQAELEARNEATGPVFKIKDDPRITKVGKLLRRTSLDEFPQLVNVLRGEMSLVGPRPLPTRDVHRFAEAALMRRFSVRPGLTCLWQVSGRSELDFQEWIRLDLKYIDEWSMRMDLWILLRTIPVVLKGTGAA